MALNAPAMKVSTLASSGDGVQENASTTVANPAAVQTCTPGRSVSRRQPATSSEASTAPAPLTAISKPRPEAPIPNSCSAKTGSRFEYGITSIVGTAARIISPVRYSLRQMTDRPSIRLPQSVRRTADGDGRAEGNFKVMTKAATCDAVQA